MKNVCPNWFFFWQQRGNILWRNYIAFSIYYIERHDIFLKLVKFEEK